ncbi:MAG: M20/M25/M40 family metallo-hydrolase [Candidatus Cloacimonetes bacterium]|nr:M20/M25/M40 family metallo-hydrolase [Candidatus Cloacimonadota bacterium]MCF7814312.1 M20/M25/M40 family metallo-hydrolase [Candidatus Cloacimonadota bacterium]MCF7868389.1 M20/M25/M40 family metallo-hydrolase [Candidatus Cloacimonadota bacterium]MCF7883846.1 M20/M25/M40 family metallo-hydrolase [Candidatus Cloacimonadota bacterium]
MKKTITEYFVDLVTIDSESKNEKAVAEKLKEDLINLGAEVKFDKANEITGGNVGNLYAYFPGEIKKTPIIFCAHMDTVQPGNGIKPQIDDNIIKSDGTTILGSDDKSGIVEILWAIKDLKDKDEKHAPIEVLFTISEETGLLGAKYLDYTMISSKVGYALDGHEVGSIAIAAPSQNSLKFSIIGLESHAGVEPEKGINAIQIAAEAITRMPNGRIDGETTCNVGIIKGGKATNIVPNQVEIDAEVRSHDTAKLKEVTDKMIKAVKDTVSKYHLNGFDAKAEIKVAEEYTSFRLTDDDQSVQLAKQATRKLQLSFKPYIGGGGSDVNIFNKNGLKMAVAGTGMDKVHTVNEQIRISDLENGAKWVKEVIRIYSEI